MRGILVTEGVRGEGGILRNGKGERFMERVRRRSKKDLSLARRASARAIYREVRLRARHGQHGGAYLDITHRGADCIKRKLPSMYEQFLALGDVDITKEPMEVGPTIHYTMGGVRAEPETARDERARPLRGGRGRGGVHGANRLGGNALCDLLVFGKRAGENGGRVRARPWRRRHDRRAQSCRQRPRRVLAPFERGGREPLPLHEELQAAMQELRGSRAPRRSCRRRSDSARAAASARERAHVERLADVQPRLAHVRATSGYMLTICRDHRALRARAPREPRRATGASTTRTRTRRGPGKLT